MKGIFSVSLGKSCTYGLNMVKFNNLLFTLLALAIFVGCNNDNAHNGTDIEKEEMHTDDPGSWEDSLSGSVCIVGCSFEAELVFADQTRQIGPQGTRADSDWISSDSLDYIFEFDYDAEKSFLQTIDLQQVIISGKMGDVVFDSDITVVYSNNGNEQSFLAHATGAIMDNIVCNAKEYRETGNRWTGEILVTWQDGEFLNSFHVKKLVKYLSP